MTKPVRLPSFRRRPRGEATPRLTARFALWAGVALVLAAGAGLLVLRANAERRAQSDVYADARFAAERLGRDDLAGTAFRGPVGEGTRAQLDEVFNGGLAGPGVLRVALFSPDGLVSYSTDHALIGTRPPDAAHATAALQGGVHHARMRLPAGADALVSYVPVHWLLAGGGRPDGVLAVYRDYAPVAARLRNDFLLQSAVLAGALLLLYGALFPILRRVTATLRERHRRLLEQQRALRVSESRYRTLMEQASDGILVRDVEGGYLDANAQACTLLGYTREELLGKNIRDLIDPATLASAPLRTAELAAGETLLQDRVFLRRDGSRLEVEEHARMLEDGRVLVSFRDATERRRADAALRQLAAIVEATDEAIVGLDVEGRIRSWNGGAERTFGYRAAEVLGAPAAVLLPPERDDELPLLLERVAGGERIAHYQTAGLRRDATPLDLSLTLTAVAGGDGEVAAVSLIARDVTERKRLGEQTRQAQRLEAVSRLASAVAHELGGVASAIDAEGEVLLEALPAADPLRFQVQEMRRAADRAAALTRQLHAFGGQQPVENRIVDVNVLLDSCEATLRPLLGDAIQLDLRPARTLGRVEADPVALEHALLTLAENAREAMAGGGRLTIETTNVDLAEEVVREQLHLDAGGYVLVTVRDTGAGMDDDTRSRAFEPFFSTTGARGLGLSRVYGIVEQAGGTIALESAPDRGTTVRIYLPRVERPADELGQPADDPLRGDETVLVVEDDPIVRSLLRRLLDEYGYTVLVAEGGAEALALCGTYPGPVDLLLTDVVMPDVGGRELAERLATLRPEASVVYTSSYLGAAQEGGRDPGIAFLAKPFTRDQLARTVRGVLDARGVIRAAESLVRRHAA